jgi:adenylyltransferase/sulfurtransferase
VVGVVASIESGEALKLLTGNRAALLSGMLTVDVWTNEYVTFGAKRVFDCPACVGRRFEILEGGGAASATALCGRDAVQIAPPPGTAVALEDLERRLGAVARVARNPHLMKVWVEGCEMSVVSSAPILR